jgi:hypothetical protein
MFVEYRVSSISFVQIKAFSGFFCFFFFFFFLNMKLVPALEMNVPHMCLLMFL